MTLESSSKRARARQLQLDKFRAAAEEVLRQVERVLFILFAVGACAQWPKTFAFFGFGQPLSLDFGREMLESWQGVTRNNLGWKKSFTDQKISGKRK